MQAVDAMAQPGGADAAFEHLLRGWQARIEQALAARLPDAGQVPQRLHEAMRYAVLGGGKRVRPLLLFATARTLGLDEDQVEGAACAIELIHAYSLVHDDLPAMDDDDLRRGRPTCHRAFDEATAVLAGDALQPLAFELLATDAALPTSPAVRVALVALLAEASGSLGMAGGQAIDLAAKGRPATLAELEGMHRRKTGALIRASVMMAAACRPELSAGARDHLQSFAEAIGLAFQIQDDVLDITSDIATLGKAVGADEAHERATYPAMSGLPAARARIARLHGEAADALAGFGEAAAPLRSIADWLLTRRN